MTNPVAPPPPSAPAKKKTSGLAITAFVLALIVCLPPLSLVGGILGVVALVKVSRRDDVGGAGLAAVAIGLAGLSVIVGGIMAAIAIPNFIDYQARSKQAEAKANLMVLYTGERAYAEEHGGAFSPDMKAIGFEPERGNRYAYFLAPSGATDLRNGKAAAPPHPVIIAVDTAEHADARPLATLAATGCPVTLKRDGPGTPLSVGVTGSGADETFTAVAAGNIDGDPTLDCWSISSADRLTASGRKIPEGVPYNEQDDVKR